MGFLCRKESQFDIGDNRVYNVSTLGQTSPKIQNGLAKAKKKG